MRILDFFGIGSVVGSVSGTSSFGEMIRMIKNKSEQESSPSNESKETNDIPKEQ